MLARFLSGLICAAAIVPAHAADRATIDALVVQHAQAHGIPEALVHRVIRRESNYNPRAASRGNFGLMQIRLGTARGVGYTGSASGLLDADTNLTYAVAYLAQAYRVAGGNPDRAVRLYASGFYHEAKRKGLSTRTAAAQPAAAPAPRSSTLMTALSFQAAPSAVQATAGTGIP
ncbi:MAG TPA: transglycosylase SLT domain-containing protein [Microvirga sp.]|jgi:soluble lytic murein transglycosylase-like protein|nr:transglycosylase SLT domain-containing protein [Microvirga sp.]